MTIFEDYSLKAYNTFGINVYTEFFCQIENRFQLKDLIKFAKEKRKEVLIIGQGSNILFTRDLNFIVAKLNFDSVRIFNQTDNYIDVLVEAGKKWDELVSWAVENNFYGIENLSFIPGTAGSAPVQNIGAYGVEIKDVLLWVEVFDPKQMDFYKISSDKCGFKYRSSIFKTKLQDVIITAIALRLKTKPEFNLTYKDLQPYQRYKNLKLKSLRLIIGKIRSQKLPDPTVIGNAGSFFKNPILPYDQAEDLKKRFPQMPQFRLAEGVKIPAGWLIDYLGYKGYREGDAGVYQNNALVLVNYGNATGQQILNLAKKIQSEVLKTFNIKLEPEVKII